MLKTAVQWSTTIVQSGKGTVATLSFLAIVVVLAIQLHPYIGVPLLPVFELSFDAIRQAAHLFLDWAIFSWLVPALHVIHFVLALPFSLPLLPDFPNWRVPLLVKDLSILSIVLVRAFEVAYLIVPQAARDSARDSTTVDQWASIRQAQGPVVSRIHAFAERLNRRMYYFKDGVVKLLTFPWRYAGLAVNNPMESATNKFVREIVLGALMIGYVRLVGYLCFAVAWGVDAPLVGVSRRTFSFFLASLAVALAMVGVFFWANAFVCSRLESDALSLAVRVLGVCKARI